MGDVVDVRPDRFLREMREHGDFKRACAQSQMTVDEVEQLCSLNLKFDLAQVECQLEYIEDIYTQHIEKVIADARLVCDQQIEQLREQAWEAYRNRHG